MSRYPRVKPRISASEVTTKSYKTDFQRRLMLQKSFKGNEKGVKRLGKLPDTMHTGIEVLWRQKLMCDIELITPDRRHFKAHKLVLATCCDYFYDIFVESEHERGLTSQVEVQELTGKVLEVILEAMYTGKVRIEASNVDDILQAASTLGVFVVMEACEDFLMEFISRENCLQLLGTAFKYSLNRLTDSALEIAAKNFQVISRKSLFRSLSVEHLIPMLKRNDLEVENELEVFQRMRSWIEDDRQSRLQHAANVMSTIRLPLLDPTTIVDNIESCSYLMDITECQKLVKEALHYHCMPARQCLLQSPRTVPRQKCDACLVTVGGAPRMKTDKVCDAVMKYDAVNNKWDHVTTMPEPRHHHAVATLNGFLYVAGGETTNDQYLPLKTVCRFDPRNSSWMQVASMQNCRQSFQLGVLNGALYAVGGRVGKDESLSSVERYDPSRDRWDEVAPLSSPRRCVAVGCLGGRLYAVGGSGEKVISARVERYNPADNRWDIVKPINKPRFFGHLISIQTYLVLLSGATIDADGNLVCLDTVERYCSTTNQWTVITTMRTPRSECGCALVREKVYILGGYNWNASKRLSDAESFDTDTHSWSTIEGIDQPLTGIGVTALTLYESNKSEGRRATIKEVENENDNKS